MSKYANWPPEGQSTTKKVSGNRTTYQPLELTDAAVYDMARHWYTVEEVAARFKVTAQTVLDKHGDAFNEGKANGMTKPRMLLDKIFTDFAESGLNFANPTVPVANLLKAMELHAKKYEGLGKEAPAVQINAPSVSEIKFEPLVVKNED